MSIYLISLSIIILLIISIVIYVNYCIHSHRISKENKEKCDSNGRHNWNLNNRFIDNGFIYTKIECTVCGCSKCAKIESREELSRQM